MILIQFIKLERATATTVVENLFQHKLCNNIYLLDKSWDQVGNKFKGSNENIARGTTDPGIDSVTWIKFDNNMAPLALAANLATIWHHLY